MNEDDEAALRARTARNMTRFRIPAGFDPPALFDGAAEGALEAFEVTTKGAPDWRGIGYGICAVLIGLAALVLAVAAIATGSV